MTDPQIPHDNSETHTSEQEAKDHSCPKNITSTITPLKKRRPQRGSIISGRTYGEKPDDLSDLIPLVDPTNTVESVASLMGVQTNDNLPHSFARVDYEGMAPSTQKRYHSFWRKLVCGLASTMHPPDHTQALRFILTDPCLKREAGVAPPELINSPAIALLRRVPPRDTRIGLLAVLRKMKYSLPQVQQCVPVTSHSWKLAGKFLEDGDVPQLQKTHVKRMKTSLLFINIAILHIMKNFVEVRSYARRRVKVGLNKLEIPTLMRTMIASKITRSYKEAVPEDQRVGDTFFRWLINLVSPKQQSAEGSVDSHMVDEGT